MKIINGLIITLSFCLLLFGNLWGQPINSSKFLGKQNDKSLEIIKKPQAFGSKSCPEGLAIVKLKVTFHSSGKVTDVEVSERSDCEAFDKNAIKAAKKIKFNPEIKDGKPVTVIKTVQYSFHLLDKI